MMACKAEVNPQGDRPDCKCFPKNALAYYRSLQEVIFKHEDHCGKWSTIKMFFNFAFLQYTKRVSCAVSGAVL